MKTGTIVTIAVAGFIALSAVGGYNSTVTLSENVNGTYAEYQNQLKRQADLIPNLADVVKGYMNSEQKTMIDTAAARSGEVSKFRPSDVANNPELQKKLLEAQAAQGRALATLNAVREAYPNLKADRQVQSLMTELAGTQNRVTVARGNNQRAVKDYNATIQMFPRVVIARMFGFNTKPYYEAGEEAQNAPKLNFSK